MKKEKIQDAARSRILILDGAMGTAIQQYGLTEEAFRGEEFRGHSVPLKGDNDILNLTCPEVIREIHRAYIAAGADILNVSGAQFTPDIVRGIREKFPDVPIIATGGPTEETILATIEAGANAITYTPPTNGELFAESMRKYRATYTD